jgi:hypothetical protein
MDPRKFLARFTRDKLLPGMGSITGAPVASQMFQKFLQGKGQDITSYEQISSNRETQQDFQNLLNQAIQYKTKQDPEFAKTGGRLSLYNYGEGAWKPNDPAVTRTGKDVVFSLGEVQATPTQGGWRVQDIYQVNKRASGAHDLNPGGIVAKGLYKTLKEESKPFKFDLFVPKK